jgi:predicted ribosome quality control (RQC) complex YloA/Tae2 family protein
MVFYFTWEDGHVIYMGKDKFENEDLIKYGWPEDVW